MSRCLDKSLSHTGCWKNMLTYFHPYIGHLGGQNLGFLGHLEQSWLTTLGLSSDFWPLWDRWTVLGLILWPFRTFWAFWTSWVFFHFESKGHLWAFFGVFWALWPFLAYRAFWVILDHFDYFRPFRAFTSFSPFRHSFRNFGPFCNTSSYFGTVRLVLAIGHFGPLG